MSDSDLRKSKGCSTCIMVGDVVRPMRDLLCAPEFLASGRILRVKRKCKRMMPEWETLDRMASMGATPCGPQYSLMKDAV